MSGTVLPTLVNMGLVNMIMVNMVNMVMVNMVMVIMVLVNMRLVNTSMVNSGPMCGDIMKEERALDIISRLQAGGQRPEEVSQLLL